MLSGPDSDVSRGFRESRFLRSAGAVSCATIASRLLGYARDIVVAHFFGASMAADAFYAASAIPNVIRRLYAEGSLTDSFIPVYSGVLAQGKHDEAMDIAHRAFSALVLILAGVSALGVMLAPIIVRVVAPGFIARPGQYALTTDMVRIMFPYIFFIGLVALSRGVLNSFHRFTAPATAPAMLNICLILAVFFVAPLLQRPVMALAGGMLVGGMAQFVLQVPSLWVVGVRFKLRSTLGAPALRRVVNGLIPTLLGSSVCQINSVVGFVLASTLSEGSISYLYYADRLVQLPLGFIAIPLASVAFPLMAHQVRSAMGSGIADTLERSLRFILFLSFPALAGLIVLRLPIFSVLFQRGAFGHREALLCSDALLYYSLGLWAFAGLQILPRALYATDELWTPVKAGSVSVGANLALSLILLGPMGYGGLALANSLAAILYFLTLLRPLSRGLGRALIRKMAQPISRFLIASALMAIAVRGIASMGQWDHGLNGMNILVLGAAIGTGLASYLLLARVAGFPELREMGILKDNSRAERH